MVSLMKFRDFVWTKNPEKLSISIARDIKEFEIPYDSAVMQDYGTKKRIISGEGEFVGERCIKTYEALSALFEDGKSGVLKLPDLPILLAKPVSLSYIATAKPNVLRYQFLFWEDFSQPVPLSTGNPFRLHYTVTEDGESLWSIANQEHVAIESLLQLNPQINWPSYLTAGQKVVLP